MLQGSCQFCSVFAVGGTRIATRAPSTVKPYLFYPSQCLLSCSVQHVGVSLVPGVPTALGGGRGAGGPYKSHPSRSISSRKKSRSALVTAGLVTICRKKLGLVPWGW